MQSTTHYKKTAFFVRFFGDCAQKTRKISSFQMRKQGKQGQMRMRFRCAKCAFQARLKGVPLQLPWMPPWLRSLPRCRSGSKSIQAYGTDAPASNPQFALKVIQPRFLHNKTKADQIERPDESLRGRKPLRGLQGQTRVRFAWLLLMQCVCDAPASSLLRRPLLLQRTVRSQRS